MAVYRRIRPWRSMDLSTSNPQSDKIVSEPSTKHYDRIKGDQKVEKVGNVVVKLIKKDLIPI